MLLRLAYLLAGITVVASQLSDNNPCRCTSDQPCWPSNAQFRTLASQVSHPLIYPVPPAVPCYSASHPSGNCSAVVSSWHDEIWRANHHGAMEGTQWETFTEQNGTINACYLNTTLGSPCQQGSVPVIGVDARSPADIQAAVNFASKYNLRLVIKNTGHDYVGRSTAKGAFMIWTHNMKNITFDRTFSPVGDFSVVYNNTLTVEAGVQWYEAYAAAAFHNRVIVGGLSPKRSIGSAGGWISGGGHSMLSPNYGLGVDNVVQMTIVTADGQHLTVNEGSYPDLFWALRGGGGGTWGVLTSVTYLTHPNTPFSLVIFEAKLTQPNNTNPNATQNLVAEIARMTPSLINQGFGGMAIFTSPFVYFGFASPKSTLAETDNTFNPFFEYAAAQAKTGGLTIVNSTTSYRAFEPMFAAMIEQVVDVTGATVGSPFEASSWILPPNAVTGNPDYLASVLLELPSTLYFLESGGAVNHVSPDAMGLQPAWRNSLAFAVILTGWEEGANSSQINAARANFKGSMAKLEALAPESGAYLNEATAYEFDFKTSFFGTHYDELKQIKNKYDPQGLFVVHEGVGSDDWDTSLICRINWS